MFYNKEIEVSHCEYCNIPLRLHPEFKKTNNHECKVWYFLGEVIEKKEDNKQFYTKESLLEEYKNLLDDEFKDITDKMSIIDSAIEIADDLFTLDYYKV